MSKETTADKTFSKEQLLHCKALGFGPDLVQAVLKKGKAYTLTQAKEEINTYLNRKVG